MKTRAPGLSSVLSVPVLALACGSSSHDSAGADAAADVTAGDGGSSGSASSGSSEGPGGPAGPGSLARDGGGLHPGASVLQIQHHHNRDGFYVEPRITLANAPSFALTSFAGTVNGSVFASPLYVESGPSGKGTFYVATETNTVYALDEVTGAEVWHQTVGNPATHVAAGCGNLGSSIGITGTPAIDLAKRLIVFSGASPDGSGAIGTHVVYALSIDDGSLKWMVDASTLSDPTTGLTFASTAAAQNQRGGVLIVGGVAYVVYGGHSGDCGNYHGWVVGVPLSGTGARAWGTQVVKAGIWAGGGATSDGQSVFVATGNGVHGTTTWAESEGVFRLDPGPSFTGATQDYFAPYNWQSLDGTGLDMSGSAPLVIDPVSFTPSKLVLAQGKDGYLYLLDRTNLGGVATSSVQGLGTLRVSNGEIANVGAWANVGSDTYVIVRPNGLKGGIGCPSGTSGELVAVKLDASAPSKMSVAWCAASNGDGSPIITTSDGTNDALVWVFGAHTSGNGKLTAIDLLTGKTVATGGTATAAGVHKFTVPIAVHGKLYVTGDGRLYQFGP